MNFYGAAGILPSRTLNRVAVNGFLLLLTLSLPLKGGLGKTGSLKVGQ